LGGSEAKALRLDVIKSFRGLRERLLRKRRMVFARQTTPGDIIFLRKSFVFGARQNAQTRAKNNGRGYRERFVREGQQTRKRIDYLTIVNVVIAASSPWSDNRTSRTGDDTDAYFPLGNVVDANVLGHTRPRVRVKQNGEKSSRRKYENVRSKKETKRSPPPCIARMLRRRASYRVIT